MIDLTPEHLGAVQIILEHHVPDCEVRAYGSRVTGKARKYSDLDLVVMGMGQDGKNSLDALREAFAHSELPIIVDVQNWDAISETFRRIIDNEFEVIQPGKKDKTGAL